MNRLFVLILLIFMPSVLHAVPLESGLTPPVWTGIPLPSESVATTQDARAITVNPAGLALHPDLQFQVIHSEFRDVRGDAFLLQLGGLGLGFQSDWETIRKYQIPLALPLGDSGVSLGFGFDFVQVYDGLWRTTGVDFDFHAGMLFRPYRWFAAGIVGRHLALSGPIGGPDSERLDIGFAVRPGTDAITIAGDFRFLSDGDVLPAQLQDEAIATGRLTITPADGVSVSGIVENTGAAGFMVTADLAHEGITGFVHFDSAQDVAGAGGALRLSLRAYPAIAEPSGRAIEIILDGSVHEAPGGPLQRLLGQEHREFLLVANTLRRAAKDPGVSVITVKITDTNLSIAHIWEIRELLAACKSSGKKIAVYLYSAATRDMYLASIADLVVMHPTAVLRINGPAVTQIYIKRLLDKLGLSAQVVRAGKYKSAGEILSETGPSGPSEEAMTAVVAGIHNHLVGAIAEGRKLPAEKMTSHMAERPIMTAQQAKEAGFVDRVAYWDEAQELLGEWLSVGKVELDTNYSSVFEVQRQWGLLPQIVVVYLQGTITDADNGFDSENHVSAPEIAEIMDLVRIDQRVRAVVVRVNSPGGSVTASDEIRHAVERMAKDKPVIVSMASVAASGGYYISIPAHEILGSPFTLTGSIGVLSIKVSVPELLDKAGVDHHTYQEDSHASADQPFRPWTPGELKIAQEIIDYYYGDFKEKVSRARKISPEKTEALAQGRIWTGIDAHRQGLIDGFGGIDVALTRARQRAGISPDDPVEVVQLPDFWTLKHLFRGSAQEAIGAPLGDPLWRSFLALVSLKSGCYYLPDAMPQLE